MSQQLTKKKVRIVLAGIGVPLLCYIIGYVHYVHPMPIRVGPASRESVEPVFRTARHSLISLFRPAVAIDQALFPSRWDLQRFRLPPTDLAGLHQMPSFRARVESVGRTTPHSTGISTLRMGLRLESGHFLQIDEPAATEQMFGLAGSLMDTRLHEFPGSWFDAK
jgi:hypothetical protein